jgi:mono/diheme cytochrome c family protein
MDPARPNDRIRKLFLVGVALQLVLVAGAVAWFAWPSGDEPSLRGDAVVSVVPNALRPGDRVPALAWVDRLDAAGALGIEGGFEGITVVVVRDTGCPVSTRYGPRLSQMEAEWGARGVRFVYLNPGPHESPEAITDEVETFGFEGPYVHDPEGRIAAALGVRATTEVFVIDASRTLVYRGAIDDQYGIEFSRAEAREHWLLDALTAAVDGGVPRIRQTEVPGCLLNFENQSGSLGGHLAGHSEAEHEGHGGEGAARAGEGDRVGDGMPGAAIAAGGGGGASAGTSAVTYHNRVSRILQENCVACHRDGGIAPFSLAEYRFAHGYRNMILYVLENGIMPPWYASPEYGSWSNDRSLDPADRAALLRWIADGAPEGDPSEGVQPRRWAAGWNIGEPDAVFSFPQPVRIPADGAMDYQYIYVQTNFPEDRWIQRMEIRHTQPQVTHHAIVFLEAPGARPAGRAAPGQEVFQTGVDGFFAATAPGAVGVDFGEGQAKRLPAGAWLKFQMHYTPNGRAVEDVSSIGFVFADGPPAVEVETASAFNVRFRIPPHAERHEVVGEFRFPVDGEIQRFFPHTHVRGVAFRYELVQPNGSTRTLLDIPRYNFNWQLTYDAARPIPVPAGSILRATAWYDNSANNPANPDPSQEVRFGEQTWDEMMLGYFDWVRTGSRRGLRP